MKITVKQVGQRQRLTRYPKNRAEREVWARMVCEQALRAPRTEQVLELELMLLDSEDEQAAQIEAVWNSCDEQGWRM